MTTIGNTQEVVIEDAKYQVSRIGTSKVHVQGTSQATFEPHGEDTQGFLLTLGGEYIVTSGLSDKAIKFWKISSLFTESEESPKVFYEWKCPKKLTSLHWLDFTIESQDFSGIIYSDKFGEVRFFNIKNLPASAEEAKKMEEDKEENEERENNSNLWFGHQHIITHMEIAHDKKYIFTLDALKVKVTHFPEFLWVHSLVFHGFKQVTNFFVIDNLHFAVFSNKDRALKIWKIGEDSTELVKEYSGDAFQQLVGDDYTTSDKLDLVNFTPEGVVTGTIHQDKTTKAAAFKVEF